MNNLKKKIKNIVQKGQDTIFRGVHGSYLIYNTCWEDPRIDRQLLKLDGESRVVMITSAGCNALDYLLDGPAEINAVDVNPRQNALLQLKIALIKRGNYDDFFMVFGRGYHDRFKELLASVQHMLSEDARRFWKRKRRYFSKHGIKKSFYYSGTSGMAAWLLLKYVYWTRRGVRPWLFALLDAKNLIEQRKIYTRIEEKLWGPWSTWIAKQPAIMTMVGVPRPQMQLIEKDYPGGLSQYVQDKLRHVFTEVLITDNYFWRVYITGTYTENCCPNYLKPENFELLRQNVDRIRIHACTVSEFLKSNPGSYSHYILLDHQDWLAWHDPDALNEEWNLILDNSRPGSRILMRSAGIDLSFLPETVLSAIRLWPQMTETLHETDRVGTYGSLHFAEVL